ncbi:hypothetical protein [Brachybacterium paraconglomeratum]|uniref:hypothetical protein n=1 Tax=Brachybacterium paraconglomeratum TaxID=173362 RepID=UPI0002F7D59B|nr:hypothetical protein [Brachybacterium paraconglomeratum]
MTTLALISALGFIVAAAGFSYAAPRTDHRYVRYMPIPCAIGAGAQIAHALYASGVIQ